MWVPPLDLEAPTFEYAVVDSCPAEAEAKALFPEAPARTRVVVWFDGESYGGKVAFTTPAGPKADRTLRGPSCRIVLEALALAMGVAVDPQNNPVVEAREAPPETPPPPPTAHSSFLRGVDFGLGGRLGSQPTVAVAAGLSIVIGSTREGKGVWAPRARLGYSASFPTTAHAGSSSSAFYTFVARLDGCPVEFGTSRFLFSPCIRQDLGVLVGTAPQDGHRVNDFVAATGAALLAQLWLEDDGRWYLQAEAAGLVPWQRRSYTDSRGEPYFQIAPITGQFGLSMGFSTK